MPGVEIRRWDETNYDVQAVPYMAAAYRDRKWAFVSDYARLDIVYRQGGIYLDVDVELVRSLDPLLEDPAFCGVERPGIVNTGLVLAAERGNETIRLLRDAYHGYEFLDREGHFSSPPCPVLQTRELQAFGLTDNEDVQVVRGLKVYPKDYFSPVNLETFKVHRTANTYAIHRYLGSWKSPKDIVVKNIIAGLSATLGEKAVYRLIRWKERIRPRKGGNIA